MGRQEVSRPDAAAVVADDQHRMRLHAFEPELDMLGVGVSSDVRQRFLGDAVDDELLLLGEGQLRVEMAADVEARLL